MSRQPASAAPERILRGAGSRLARHVALICDGNARWARRRGVSVGEGHAAAADAVIGRVGDAIELGIAELTIYAFSTENWARPQIEVNGLVELLRERIALETPGLHRQRVRLRFIGRRRGISGELAAVMTAAEDLTKDNAGLRLFVAVNYGGRAEILDAARRFPGGGEADFGACLYAPEMHDPELIVRTGGELRLSNYLLWQAAYAELVFREELWPDFDRACFAQALAEYATRQRRFGAR
jgi:undecaprenyl diphosphate synthase